MSSPPPFLISMDVVNQLAARGLPPPSYTPPRVVSLSLGGGVNVDVPLSVLTTGRAASTLLAREYHTMVIGVILYVG